MQTLKLERGEVAITLTPDEILNLNQALNEVPNGVQISDAEFETRPGFARREVRELLRKSEHSREAEVATGTQYLSNARPARARSRATAHAPAWRRMLK